MATSVNVSVIVSAIDNASNVLKKIGKNIQDTLSKQTKTDVGGLAAATSNLGGSFGKLASAAGGVGLALGAAGAAAVGMYLTMKPLVSASIELENSMLGLATVARAFGVDAGTANSAAKTLAEDGLMTFSEAATGLKNLLATGFSLPEAINLMNTFKNAAAFNRQGTLAFGEAVVGATQGLKNQNSIMVDNSGITKNLSVILKEAGLSQNDLMLITSDASVRQKLYNGLVKEGSIFQGDAARAAETMGGQFSRLGTLSFTLRAALGDALSPAVEVLASMLGNVLTKAISFVTKHMGWLQAIALAVGTSIAMLASVVVGAARIIIGAFQTIFTFDPKYFTDAIKAAATSSFKVMYNAQTKMTDIANKAAGVQADAYEKSAKRIADASGKKKDKVTADIEKETESFEREMAKREKRFKEQLADMIFAHIDKRDSLIKDLEKENSEYSEKMSDRVKDFKDKMAEMTADHEEKVKSINDQIGEEDADYSSRLDDRKFDFANNLEEMKASHEQKVVDIEKQIDRETAKGQSADKQRIIDLQDELAQEIFEYETKEAKENEIFDRETLKNQDEHKKRLTAFQQRLLDEEIEHKKSIEKAQAAEAAATAKIVAEHQARVDDYQAKIKTEEEILKKHEGDVAAVKDKARDDDITRLKNQQAEERKEAEEDHKRKVVEMKERGTAEGAAYGGGMLGGLDPKLTEIKDNLEKAGKAAGESFAKGIVDNAARAGKEMVSKFFENIGNTIKGMANRLGRDAKYVAGAIGGEAVEIARGLGFIKQTGGIVPGAVNEPVPILAHGQERITPSGLSTRGGGSGLVLNVNVGYYMGTETEKRNIARDLYAALVQVAQSQNKTVKELMGG